MKKHNTHSQRFKVAALVLICLISGAPEAVLLNNISFEPTHGEKGGVMLVLSHFEPGLRFKTTFKKSCENALMKAALL